MPQRVLESNLTWNDRKTNALIEIPKKSVVSSRITDFFFTKKCIIDKASLLCVVCLHFEDFRVN